MKRLLVAAAAVACLTTIARTQGADSSGRVIGGILGRTPIDPRKDIAFQAVVLPETVYVGQQATYQVGVFLSDDFRARLRRNPQFVPPEVRSVLAFDLPSPSIAMTRTIGDRRFDVHVFQRALFPLTAGRQEIPSARLDYALPLSNSFFAREENHSERTSALFLVARDPPVAGRPQDYRGAVGRLTATARFPDARQARVGDPIVYTMSVDGVGNVSLLPRPPLQLGWADVVSGEERVQTDSNATLLRGRKHFDWIITPRRPGVFMVPPLRYPYFNPYTERYEVAVTAPESLRVGPGGVAAAQAKTDDSLPALPIRRIYSGEEPVPITSQGGYWLVIAFAPVPALLLGLTRRPKRRDAPTHDRLLRTLASSRQAADAATLRRTYAAAIAARVMATPAAMSHHTELVRTLRRAGVSAQTANTAEQLLAELDAVVFGRSGPLPANAARRAHDVVRAVDVEARSRQDIAARIARVATVVILLVSAGAWAAERDAVAVRAFGQGVQSYDGHDFNAARGTFFDLARERPRAADAWANFGTASWESHDTAAAVVGWQRALRLQPMSIDVRQSLELTPGYAGGFFGNVAPLSLTMFGVAGGVLWLAGWAALMLTARRGRPRSRAGTLSVGAALLVALFGLAQRDVLDGRRAAVVVSAVRLRSAPALGAETGAETINGEVARVEGRQGAWTHVRLSDGRRGWVESRRLQPLGSE